MTSHESVLGLRDRVGGDIIGQERVVERLLIGLLAKTRAVKSMAKHLQADFSRIQFTPDLLPSDITGCPSRKLRLP